MLFLRIVAIFTKIFATKSELACHKYFFVMQKKIILFSLFSLITCLFSFKTINVTEVDGCVRVIAAGYKNNFGRWEEVVTAYNDCAYKVEAKIKIEVWRQGSWVTHPSWFSEYHLVVIDGYSSKSFLNLTVDGEDDIRGKIISVERK